MKRSFFLLVAASLLITSAAFAQIEKGAILVGASSNLGFTSFQPKDGDSFSQFSIDGKVGYFFIDNLAAGVNIGYQKIEDASVTSLGLFARYYVNGKIFIGAGFNSNKEDDGFDGEASYTTIPLEVGYAAFITDNIAIEPALSYSLYSGDVEGSTFGLNVGFSLYLGR